MYYGHILDWGVFKAQNLKREFKAENLKKNKIRKKCKKKSVNTGILTDTR